MALILTINTLQQTSCTELVITDSTGEFNAVSNTTGWQTATSGGTNIQIDDDDIEEATITLTNPAGTDIVIDLMDTTTWQAITPYTAVLPFTSTVDPAALTYTLNESYLGTITDGIWTLVYYVKDKSGNEATSTFTQAFFCNIKCCVYSLLVTVPDYYNCQSCDNKYIDAVVTIWGLYQSLKIAACSATTDRFNDILVALQNACDAMGLDC